ncbi:hypothetical protein LI216_08615 [Mediterraneibacter glycyrrhizinilyticus]|uniref:hypothetical protein n=1 Tax=Mediterraneibacter glycyrrhizinilyticus TaxID=342942 RepID=UPI001D07BEDE|nr:hypothetical protein [Mediterraneibacter glycyrrhizinilyticus]MCB6309760.1 hypothetical protein [Lachnospiraceae bacterium 210521-DFI.1.109]MCB6427132.1 hypothetical protein [Mediterraneibacter glycyrrhizinilyticus]
MSDIIKFNSDREIVTEQNVEIVRECNDLAEMTEEMLLDARKEIANTKTLSVPIAELALLGTGVASLIPALRKVTQTTTFNTQGLYQLANAGVGDTLKIAKNGNFWGAFKTADGSSKFAQLQAAEPLSTTSTAVMPIDPATMMMAVALFAIEQQLKGIEEKQKQILSFLEIEKESETEADVEILSKMITTYKHNWNNEHFIASNHKRVLDIQRTARKNMLSYKKKVAELLDSKKLIVAQAKVKSTLSDLQKKFKYYRLSLYTFSMASVVEIMLSGNFKEAYIADVKTEIKKFSLEYRDLFTECSMYLEKMASGSVEANVMKGIGVASKAVGKFIGSIPVVKEGQVDEFLQDGGAHLKENAQDMQKNILESFATLHNPGTGVFMEKMEDMIQIYNHTDRICFDDKNIYLIAG